ncbi:MAG: hypothetical protein PHY34_03865 [Patescibacteria group bacterium]|nr:hypothetical protein [Patescibacteria group bacterium]
METKKTIVAHCPQCGEPLNVSWQYNAYHVTCTCGFRQQFSSLLAGSLEIRFVHADCGHRIHVSPPTTGMHDYCPCGQWEEKTLIERMDIVVHEIVGYC